MRSDTGVEDLMRRLAPQVLGALVRRYGHFDACEDAVQEALLAAATRWPAEGLPRNPRGWLTTVASRRLIDRLRSDEARRRREDADAARTPTDSWSAPGPGDRRGAGSGDTDVDIGEVIGSGHAGSGGRSNGTADTGGRSSRPAVADTAAGDPAERDDTLALLFMCCHPALSPPSQLALTLRAVGGLTTAEIARAFLVPEATMAQRISRAKQRIRAAGARFGLPAGDERDARLRVVLHVLYLMFNEGYVATAGPDLQRADLTRDAVRLAREVHRLVPDDGDAAGLLALMVLTEARRPARTGPDGGLVALADQDRSLWDRAAIAEGVALISSTLATTTRLGPYQLQAAIAAVHDEAARADDTDWPQIKALYGLLERVSPNPVVTLNRAVAVAMVDGPRAGLDLVATLEADDRVAGHHRLGAVRAHLLEMAGEHDEARAGYREAARLTTSLPEQRYLLARAARLTTADEAPPDSS
ncbi:MAG TPA: sigma-70 family RNA polymerase sigma factor [Acidimicrobiales bacterium]